MDDYIHQVELTEQALSRAVEEAKKAYKFSPGSFTYQTLTGALSAQFLFKGFADIVKQLS